MTTIRGDSHVIQIKRGGHARIVQLGADVRNRDTQYRRTAVFSTATWPAMSLRLWYDAIAQARKWDYSLGIYYTATAPEMDASILEYGPWRSCNR